MSDVFPAETQNRPPTTARAFFTHYPSPITHHAEAKSTLTLVLNPLTGMVQVLDGYKEPKPAAPVPEQYRPFLLLSGA